ncbi:MAG: transglycosylase SLT domain-containing protein [Candidatus Magnetomorum sp.]|nr:transglycosylase SLT domain-containing protein [Candidatus Magnetomorum sp.]
MKYCYLILPTLLIFCLVFSASASDEDAFNAFLKEQNEVFSSYIDEEEKDFEKYKTDIMQKWGEFVGSTQKEWVMYDKDKTSRSQVDYEKGIVTIDILLPVEQKQPVKVAEKKIIAQLKKTVSNEWPAKKNPLTDQVLVEEKQPLSQKNVDTFVQKELKKNITIKKLPPTADKVQKQKVTVAFKLVPDHLKIRAEQYKPAVLKYANKRNIDPSVIFGMIHTESCFNPMARSHIPAYGLMQIVPKSGGVDAYEFVFKKKKTPSAKELYEPDFNIRLGVAYIDKIKNIYFKSVENETSSYLMTVAAYNTGIGNVSKAFTGRTVISPAVKKVNAMSPKQVHHQLMNNLTYDEPKKYVQRVFERSKMYR